MAHGDDVDQPVAFRNPVDHAPLPDADAPQVIGAFDLLDARRARLGRQRFDASKDASRDGGSRF
ncbi:MAG: hypothetical protein R3357_11665 [Burkholderiales bacterium]|nr:hypothetical protein [Burkholderiales bacterium]